MRFIIIMTVGGVSAAPNFACSVLVITFYATSQNFNVENMIITIFIDEKTLQKHFDKNNSCRPFPYCLRTVGSHFSIILAVHA